MEDNIEVKGRIRKVVIGSCVVICLLVIYYFLFSYFPKLAPKCLFFELVGFNCPGCGISRMLSNFIKLNFIDGIKFNYFLAFTMPFVLFAIAYSVYLYLINKKANKVFNVCCFVYLVLLIIWGFVRNIVGI